MLACLMSKVSILKLGQYDMVRGISLRGLIAAENGQSFEPLPDRAELRVTNVISDGDRASPLAPSRRGRKALTVHVDLETHVRLKVMAAREVTTLEALVAEALGMLFAKRRDRDEFAASDGRYTEPDQVMGDRSQK